MYYRNNNANSLFQGMEIIPLPAGNETFFYGNNDSAAALENYITGTLGQQIVARTRMNGQNVVMTTGSQAPSDLTRELAKHSVMQQPDAPEKPMNPWKWRGGLNIVGQSLQLASGALKQGGLDAPKLIFAGTNLLASAINIKFGAQHEDDSHQLRFLKEKVSHILAPQVSDPKLLPSPDDHRSGAKTDAAQGFTGFIRRHSVRLGEMGLRYFASVALTFPMTRWKPAIAALRSEGLAKALATARNPDNTSFYAGAIYLVGKTIGLFSKTPDPYNPKPSSMLDRLREKVFFRTSSIIETLAASTLALGSFTKGEISIRGRKSRDYVGGVGGLFLASALTTRIFAPFGVKDVDMTELKAHFSDLLALVPPNKHPQALADTAAALKEHFGEKLPSLGLIYHQLANEVYRNRETAALSSPANIKEEAGHTAIPPKRNPEEALSHTQRLMRDTLVSTAGLPAH